MMDFWFLKSCDVHSSFCSSAPMQDSTSSLSSSLYEMVDTPAVAYALEIPPCAIKNFLPTNYILWTQSSHLYNDTSVVGIPELNTLFQSDVQDCIMEVGDGIAANLFPDETFSFPINNQFVKNFCGSFISTGKLWYQLKGKSWQPHSQPNGHNNFQFSICHKEHFF